MISSTTEYAIRAVIHLASRPGESVAAHDVAEATKVPAGYLPKILQDLVHAGLVSSRRGPNGGFTLARDPTKLRLVDIVAAVEPARRDPVCPLGGTDPALQCCFHRRLAETQAVIDRMLNESKISDFIDGTAPGAPCPFALPGPEAQRRRRAV